MHGDYCGDGVVVVVGGGDARHFIARRTSRGLLGTACCCCFMAALNWRHPWLFPRRSTVSFRRCARNGVTRIGKARTMLLCEAFTTNDQLTR